MQVEYAFFCRYAESENIESINALGIGTRRYIRVPKLPIQHKVDVVILLRMEDSEAGDHDFKLVFQDQQGTLISEPFEQKIVAKKSPDGGHSYVSIIARVDFLIQTAGRQKLLIQVDGKEVHRLAITVELETQPNRVP